MPGLSNWREEFNLSEVVTGKMTDKEALKKVSEKSGINNKVTINPKLDEAVKEIGGEVVSMVEADTTAQKQRLDMKQMILDRQKLKLRRKDMSAAKQEKKLGVDGDATNASKQANVIAQEEVELDEAERKLADRLARKRKLYDKTLKKAMQFARDEGEASGHARYRMGSIDREMDGIRAKMKKEEVVTERLGGKGYKPYTSLTGKKVSGDWEDSDRGAGNKAKKRAGGKVEKKSPTYRAYVLNKEAKEEQGRSDYGKASVRNKRKFGKEGEPAIFDASGERGKMIDQRRAEHKAKRGVKEGYEEKKTSEVLAAFKRDPKVRKRFEKAAKKEDGPGSVKNRAADSMLQTAKDTAKRKGDTSKSDDRYAYEETNIEVREGVMKMVKRVMSKKKPEKKAEKAMDAGARARRKLQQKDHETVNFLPMNEEDKAFKFVLDKIKKEVGKSGYISKNNPRKPQTDAEKAKVRAHQAKIDKENAAERAKDPSQGRYPKG